jgi:hypothetical protein
MPVPAEHRAVSGKPLGLPLGGMRLLVAVGLQKRTPRRANR